MRYRAFISYSHADALWARWLMRRLETYRVPARLVGTIGTHGPIGARLGAFFRDREELPSAGDLGTTIRAAMAESAALVVICSPAAAASRWVDAEVAAFRDSGRGDRVFCFVVAGKPGSEDSADACFPPALLAPDAHGDPIEPLAADARPEGDGRERAFLKLVAGLLGVGYDTLAQREAQRRNRTLAVVALASLVGMSIAIGLALAAYVARNDAQRRQAQAEDILGFMLGDLRRKLTTVGRLDLMRAVDDKAIGYFATLDPRDMSDRTLEEQARSLAGIGEVRLGEGNHDAAMKAFREAHARSTALREREPANGQRLFDLAQAEYWIGFVALQQGRFDDAEKWFRNYRDSAIHLAAMDRNNFDWQKEVAYGHHNLAVLDESRGRYAEAERAMLQALELRKAWSEARPGDAQIRRSVANTMSWLGSLSALQGKLADAERYFAEEVGAISRNSVEEPLDARWKKEHAEALLFLARTQMHRGRLAEARASVAAAVPLTEALANQDPGNNDWQVAFGISRWSQAQLAAAASEPAAAAHAEEAAAAFALAYAAEPQNQRLRGWLIRARNLQARLALRRDDVALAQALLTDSATLTAPAQNSPNETLRQIEAERLVLSGETAQLAGDNLAAATAWQQAERLLLADADNGLPFDRLDLLVRTLRHLNRAELARPHEQRLAAAAYVPLQPWPAHATVVAR